MDRRNGFRRFVTIFGLGFCLILPPVISAAEEPPNTKKPWQCTLRLLDLDGKPVPDGKVTAFRRTKEWIPPMQVWESFEPRDPQELVSDQQGHATIRFSESPAPMLYVDVDAEGFAPLRYEFGKAWWSLNDFDLGEMPDPIDVHLERGTRAGGVVRDSHGNPIEGVGVVVVTSQGNCIRLDDYPVPEDVCVRVVKTNSAGKWSCRVPLPNEDFELPESELTESQIEEIRDALKDAIDGLPIRVCFYHPQHAPKQTACLPESVFRVFEKHESLLNAVAGLQFIGTTTFDTVLEDGVHLSGRVVDESGKPLEAARVVVKSKNDPIPCIAAAESGKDGRFSFRLGVQHLLRKPPLLFAASDGFAPRIRRLKPHANKDPLRLVLKKAKRVKLRVLDSAGRTVCAHVSVSNKKGNSFNAPLNLPKETDADGNWTWSSAPKKAYIYTISTAGFEPVRYKLRPGDHTITLKRTFLVIGRVVDAETNVPIKRYYVSRRKVLGDDDRKSGDDFRFLDDGWHDLFIADSPDGVFRCVCAGTRFDMIQGLYVARSETPDSEDTPKTAESRHPEYAGAIFRIEAEGYAPLVTKTLPWKEGTTELALRMKKAKSLTGRIVDTEGRPVAGAEIVVAGKDLAPAELGIFYRVGFSEALWTSQKELCRDETDPDCCLRFYTVFDRDNEVSKQPRHTLSDDTGRFKLFPQNPPYELIVAHEDGFARIPSHAFKPGSDIVLHPWASVEGIVKAGGKPLPNAHIRIDLAPPLGDVMTVSPSIRTTTDSRGHFQFDRVPATRVKIAQAICGEFDLLIPFQDPVPLKTIPLKTMVLSPGKNKTVQLEGTKKEKAIPLDQE